MAHRIADLKCRANSPHSRDLLQRQLRTLAVGLQEGSGALPRGRRSRPKRLRASSNRTTTTYFVLKPEHSAFFATTLDVPLSISARARSSWRASPATTASCSAPTTPTHARLSPDCAAGLRRVEHGRREPHALEQMQKVLKADITPSESPDLDEILRQSALQPRAWAIAIAIVNHDHCADREPRDDVVPFRVDVLCPSTRRR